MNIPTLHDTQRLLWKLITAPEGTAAGLADLNPQERGVAESLVRADSRMSAVERIDIYANMYFYRIHDCLRDDFPALRAVLGEIDFHDLITDYLLAHPPTHFSLRHAGRHLADYLSDHPFAEARPYLADLAALEWSVMEVFDAPDAEPLAATTFGTIPQDRWPDLRLQVTPAFQLLRSPWPVHTAWQRTQDGEALGNLELQPQPTILRVWRQDLRVFQRPIDAAEDAGLTAILAGASFADVCQRIVEHDPAADAQRAFALLGKWITDGLLTGFTQS